MSYLILVRHGESLWNLNNLFTGWVDVPLSEKGIKEAVSSSKKIKDIDLDVAFTSELERAHETLMILLANQKKTGIFLHDSKKRKKWALHPHNFEKNEIPIYSSDKINERFYGSLQGMNKDEARERWGHEVVHRWRRSWEVRPPKGESLKDVSKRTTKYLIKKILPEVKNKKNVIVVAHGNSLRTIIKYLDGISNEDIPKLELPTGLPIIYKYSRNKLVHTSKHSFTRRVHWRKK